MFPSRETISTPSAPSLAQSRLGWAGNLLAIVGASILVVSPSTTVSALSLALLVAGLALQPAFGLALLGASLPFYLHPKQLGPMAFSLPELILLSSLAGAAIYALLQWGSGHRRSIASLATPLDGPVALFLAAALLSLLASELLRVSLRDLRTLVLEPVAAYYLAVWFLRSRKELAQVVGGLLLGGALVALYGLYQYLLTDQVTAVEGVRRIQGSYLSPNHLGLYLGRLLPMSLALTLFLWSGRRATPGLVPGARASRSVDQLLGARASRPPRSASLGPAAGKMPALPATFDARAAITSTILTALLAAALLLTFSVGAWLASAIAVLAVVLLWRPRAGLLVAGGYAAVLAAGVPILSLERISSHFTLTRGTSFIRIHLWQSSLQMIRDHPLLGVGMDNFLYYYRSSYLLPEAAAEPNLSHPHNLILNFWLQMGILGVAAVGWLAAALGRSWYRCWHYGLAPMDRALLAGVAGSAVDLVAHGMVDNSYFLVDLAFNFWLCAAAVVVLSATLSPRGRIE